AGPERPSDGCAATRAYPSGVNAPTAPCRRGARARADERHAHRCPHLWRRLPLGEPDDGDPARHCGPLGTHASCQARPAAQPGLRAAYPLPGVLPGAGRGPGAARLRLPVRGRLMFGLTRSHPKGLADLLNYAALVDEGICLLKDGAFLAAWS